MALTRKITGAARFHEPIAPPVESDASAMRGRDGDL
jgi:hypothetical protein